MFRGIAMPALCRIFTATDKRYYQWNAKNNIHAEVPFEKENINYHLNYEKEQTFKNITTSIINNKYVIISKIANPAIHFVIKHPKLVEAIDNFNPLVKE